MTVSEQLRSCWGPSRLAHHGDLRSSQYKASLRNYSTTSHVSHYLLSCFRRFLPALQQNRAQSRLLYLLNRKKSINYNLVTLNFFFLSLECQCVQMRQIALRSVFVNYKYSTHQPFILKFISEFILLSQLIYVIVQTMRAVLSQCCW